MKLAINDETHGLSHYVSPKAEAIEMAEQCNLMSSLSLRGQLYDWELDDEIIDLEEPY